MKTFCVLAMLAFAMACAGLVRAETGVDYSGYDSAPGPGMEEKKVNNDVTILMPKGSRMRKRNETTQIMEGVDEYSARRFVDVDKRLDRIEKDIAEIKEAVLYLKSKLSTSEKSADENPLKSSGQ